MSHISFESGRIVITPMALAKISDCGTTAYPYLQRHLSGDWSEMSAADQRSNTQAVRQGNLRIFSAYQLPDQTTLWIITEADRSSTTILLPCEY